MSCSVVTVSAMPHLLNRCGKALPVFPPGGEFAFTDEHRRRLEEAGIGIGYSERLRLPQQIHYPFIANIRVCIWMNYGMYSFERHLDADIQTSHCYCLS